MGGMSSRQNTVECSQCPEVFDSELFLEYHMKVVHEYEDKSKIRCPDCPMKFETQTELNVHRSRHHFKQEINESVDQEMESPSDAPNSWALLEFKDLEEWDKWPESDLTSHEFCPTVRPYDCQNFAKGVESQQSSSDHSFIEPNLKPETESHIKSPDIEAELVPNPKPVFMCNICAKVAKSELSLNFHKLNEHKKLKSGTRRLSAEPTFDNTCEMCGRVCKSELNLNYHKLSRHKSVDPLKAINTEPSTTSANTNSKQYDCYECEEKFPNKGLLYKHKNTVHSYHSRKWKKKTNPWN